MLKDLTLVNLTQMDVAQLVFMTLTLSGAILSATMITILFMLIGKMQESTYKQMPIH